MRISDWSSDVCSSDLLWSANFSLGVALLEELVERAAGALAGWDCDIVEMHHTRKLDAPSGTALALGAAAENAGATPRYASLRDRKSVVSGKRMSVRVTLGGCRNIQ